MSSIFPIAILNVTCFFPTVELQVHKENHPGILYKLCSVDIEGSVLSILTLFLSNRFQHVMMDGCRSKLVIVVSEVPQGSV